jgi:hypothetical protein
MMVTQSKLIQCPTIEQLLSNELGNGKKWNCSGLIEGTPLSGFCVEGLWRPQKAVRIADLRAEVWIGDPCTTT